jgi:exodeoxyribonuclease VII large subunit
MIVARARAEIAMQRARLEGWNMAIGQLSPQRTLERGFAIARDQEGVVLKDAAQLASGDRVYTQLARGRFSSEVLKR